MSLTEHLDELRSMVIKVVIILIVSFFFCYGVGEHISEILLAPLREALSGNLDGQVVYLGLLDKVLSQFQVAFWTSIIVSSPIWFYQLWTFIRPALYENEAKMVRPFILIGFLLFCLGVAFGYFIVFPLTFQTLMQFGVGDVSAQIGLKDYLTLASKVLVFLGVIFQLPNALLILGFMGIVTKESLRSFRRYVYVGFAVVAAALTPPDIITMLGLWLPLTLLFEIGILGVAIIVHPILKRREEKYA